MKFQQDGVRLSVRVSTFTDLLIIHLFFGTQFTTPSFPGDPFLGPYPITFITYKVTSTDGMEHKVEIYYDNTGEVC